MITDIWTTQNKKKGVFEKIASVVSKMVGSPIWFISSLVIVVIWVFSGPLFNYSETWQLIINTVTTILTFLMMSLLHATQSKWEHKMETFEKHQQRALKILEKDTIEIKTNLTNQSNNTN